MSRVFDQDGQYLGAAEDAAATPRGYAFDPLGNPIPDPSGVLEQSNYEQQTADFALEGGQAVADAAANAANYFVRGVKLILYGGAILAGLIVIGEAQRLMPALPDFKRKRRARRKGAK